MKIAVLGASGMLGSMLVRYLSQHFEVITTVRDRWCIKPMPNVEWRMLDVPLATAEKIKKAIAGAEYVINAIGVIKQKIHPSLYVQTFDTNAIFPRELARVAESINCQVIQIATDCVYSGCKGWYTESDKTDPQDYYGISKRMGEHALPNMHHLRCSIIGPARDDYSLLGWFLSQPEGAVVEGYSNHYWNGITTLHFAKLCHGIMGWGVQLPHLCHIVPKDAVSKCELLHLFRKYFNREDITVIPVENDTPVNRTLATNDQFFNRALWSCGGYAEGITIENMVRELAEYVKSYDRVGDKAGDYQAVPSHT